MAELMEYLQQAVAHQASDLFIVAGGLDRGQAQQGEHRQTQHREDHQQGAAPHGGGGCTLLIHGPPPPARPRGG